MLFNRKMIMIVDLKWIGALWFSSLSEINTVVHVYEKMYWM